MARYPKRRLVLLATVLSLVGSSIVASAAPIAHARADKSRVGVTKPVNIRVPIARGDVLALALPGIDGVTVALPNPPDVGGFRPIAKLWVNGWDASFWTEYSCVTGDGRYMAVAFGPAQMTNNWGLQSRGAFGAVVDLRTGNRWVLPYRVALVYHSPGCGTGDTIVWSRSTGTANVGTDLIAVDAAKSKVIGLTHVGTSLASAVPVGQQIWAARGATLVSVAGNGPLAKLATGSGRLYDLRPNAAGGVDFLAAAGSQRADAYSYAKGALQLVGSGRLHDLAIFSGAAGANHIVGSFHATSSSHPDVITVQQTPAALSLRGSAIVTEEQLPGITAPDKLPGGTRIAVRGRHRSAVVSAPFVTPSGGTTISSIGGVAHPTNNQTSSVSAPRGQAEKNLTTAPLQATPSSPSSPSAPPGSPCSVAPLDPGTQIIQPSPQQVEWAAGMAVRGQLTTARPANWEGHGLPSYTPDSLFPVPSLVGGGHIPVQVLEGVLAQESNFSQASYHALPGVPGDPLIANYYGTVYDANGLISSMNFSNADCGYGIGQITSHMTTADNTWSAALKREVATDYEVNIAAAVQFLGNLWNQLNSSPENVTINDGDPGQIENWYAVLWAYNTGIQPGASFGNTTGCTPGPACTYNGHWGLGWTNNPAQNAYPVNRQPFLQAGYQDAAHPGNWPYQERVLGWAQYPQQDFVNGGFKYTGSNHLNLVTNYYLFCTSANNCSQSSPSTGFCLSSDRTTCWWHSPVTWLAAGAGTRENPAAYQSGQAEPTVANPYPPACSATTASVVGTPGLTVLPVNATIVDTLPDSSTNIVGCPTVASAGSFNIQYGTDGSGNPTGAIDVHQLGVGYLGHSWFTHTVAPSRTAVVDTGTWTPPSTTVGWQRIFVFIPNNGATTFQANYQIYTGTATYSRVVNQRWNQNVWFDLGSFLLTTGAHVSLSNATYSDYNAGAIDLSWDAIAFAPSSQPTVDYVALGDSYQSGEGLQPYYPDTDNGGGSDYRNACHRSSEAYPALLFNDLAPAAGGQSEFHFLACSGATTADTDLSVAPSGNNGVQWGEVPQLQTGWLDSNTTHVTVGIGGNDARFAAILNGCIRTLTDCTDPNYKLTVNGVVDPSPLVQYEPQVINGLAPTLKQLYLDIKAEAPNAKVYVVGYPHIIVTDPTQRSSSCPFIGQDINWFTQMDDLLNSVISNAASAAGVTYIDDRSAFQGPPEHEACAADTNIEWINAIIAFSSSGSSNTSCPGIGECDIPGTGSFHPKAAGHRVIEATVRAAMTQSLIA